MYAFGVMQDGTETGIVLLVLIGGPLVIAVFFGWVQYRTLTPLVFRCRRCAREFRQPPHHAFPRACPRCGSQTWNS